MRSMLAHAAMALYVVVRLYDMQGVPNDTLLTARDTAVRILRDANIDLRWHDCPPCNRPAGPVELMIRVAPASGSADAASLGFSYVDVDRKVGTLATVFSDRVHALAALSHADEGELLGRAMAHEINHLLLGTHDHTRTGLMRGKWTSIELAQNRPIDWILSHDDSTHLRQALMRRILGVRQAPLMRARDDNGLRIERE
jgi:hypothetical protein